MGGSTSSSGTNSGTESSVMSTGVADKYYKIIREDLNHSGFRYKFGLNIDTKPFKENKHGSGLHYTTRDNIFQYLDKGDLVAEVEPRGKIQKDEYCFDGEAWRTDKLFVKSMTMLEDWVATLSDEEKAAGLKKNGNLIKYIKDPSEEMQLAAVKSMYTSIRYIKNPSVKTQIAAIEQDCAAADYLKTTTPEAQAYYLDKCVRDKTNRMWNYHRSDLPVNWDRWMATHSEDEIIDVIKGDGNRIAYVENPSEKMKLAAVTTTGTSIRHIKDPSPAMQLAAIRQDCDAAEYLINLAPEAQEYYFKRCYPQNSWLGKVRFN